MFLHCHSLFSLSASLSLFSLFYSYVLFLFLVWTKLSIKGLDTLSRFSATFDKGDNFIDFLFALLQPKSLLKRGLLCKERICSLWEQILSLQSRPLFRRWHKQFWQELFPLRVYQFPLSLSLCFVSSNKLAFDCQSVLCGSHIELNMLKGRLKSEVMYRMNNRHEKKKTTKKNQLKNAHQIAEFCIFKFHLSLMCFVSATQ